MTQCTYFKEENTVKLDDGFSAELARLVARYQQDLRDGKVVFEAPKEEAEKPERREPKAAEKKEKKPKEEPPAKPQPEAMEKPAAV